MNTHTKQHRLKQEAEPEVETEHSFNKPEFTPSKSKTDSKSRFDNAHDGTESGSTSEKNALQTPETKKANPLQRLAQLPSKAVIGIRRALPSRTKSKAKESPAIESKLDTPTTVSKTSPSPTDTQSDRSSTRDSHSKSNRISFNEASFSAGDKTKSSGNSSKSRSTKSHSPFEYFETLSDVNDDKLTRLKRHAKLSLDSVIICDISLKDPFFTSLARAMNGNY